MAAKKTALIPEAAAQPLDFKPKNGTKKKKAEPIPFRIPGIEEGDEIGQHVYHFTPKKKAAMLLGIAAGGQAAIGGLVDWLGRGLSEEDNEVLLARLNDEDDWLDFEDLEGVIEMLIGKASDVVPTT